MIGTIVTSVAWGRRYPPLIARQLSKFNETNPEFDHIAWVNSLPPGAEHCIENDYDYTGYCAKPWAMLHTKTRGAEIGLLLDAAFYPIRRIHPLLEHISRTGYYFCKNGFKVGEWSSDRSLEQLGITREQAWEIDEISSYCVGFNWHDQKIHQLAEEWAAFANDKKSFPGPHTNTGRSNNDPGYPRRNEGLASTDPRVSGHRHDQTVLSVLAWKAGLDVLVSRPIFTTYVGMETEDTVLVNKGGL